MSTNKDYLSLPLKDFLADIAAKSPAPGGGSVAAAVGALGTSLARMALSYTAGKPSPAGQGDQLQSHMKEFEKAGGQFIQLMGEDMAAYEEFAAARKGTDRQKQHALLRAIAVPMEVIVLAGAMTARLDEIKSVVNRQLMPDLQAAAVLASAAARSASISAQANIAVLTNRKEAERLENQLDMLLGRLARHRNAVVHYESP